MARVKSTSRVAFEYFPLRGLFWLLGILPSWLSLLISQSLLRGLWALLPKRRKITDDNLSRAFPELNPHSRQQIAEASLMNLSRGLTVFAKIPRMASQEWTDLIHMEGLEHVEKARSQGRGLITFTAHYGCWEAMSVEISRRVPTAIVVRPLDNPRLEAMVAGVRGVDGIKIIPKRHALFEGLKALRRNMLVGILIDQNYAPGNLFVNFLGRPAATTPIVSLLARRTGCTVLPLHNVWEDGRLRVIFEPALTLSRETDRNLAMAEDTQAMTNIVEAWIRKDPRQWLWLHHRWKRQPQPGELVYTPEVWTPQPNPGSIEWNRQQTQ